jgi:hypothetical protein
VALLAVVVVMQISFWAPTADATTAPVQFGRIQYDSPGSDTGTNASLNGEYFVVRNYTGTRRAIHSWTVRDAANHVYTFPSTFVLGANSAVRVHTGKGTNTATDRYWNRSAYVWNNGGDTAGLRNASGTQIDACGWTSVGAGYKTCPT